jgi:predicted CXXCH cytochrome family protein
MRRLSMLLLILAFGFVGAGTASAQNKEVGAEKCGKMCHKVQFESWAKSKHGLDRAKGASCETCHGAGSAYMPMSVMKDPAKSKAAGLIAKPEKAGCVKCHKDGVKDTDLPNVHAHKAKG